MLKLVQDTTRLAQRTNAAHMDSNMEDLCTSFKAGIELDKANFTDCMKKTTAEIHQELLEKELGAFKHGCTIAPPGYFSLVPTLTTNQKMGGGYKNLSKSRKILWHEKGRAFARRRVSNANEFCPRTVWFI